jgi:hypothetical protein
MIALPTGKETKFKTEVSVTVGLSADVEIEYTGVVVILKDEDGTLHLQKSNGNFVEFSKSYLYFEVHVGGKDEQE